jgi:signal transduction histidine kinase/DNA-binding response OmpR family regulator
MRLLWLTFVKDLEQFSTFVYSRGEEYMKINHKMVAMLFMVLLFCSMCIGGCKNTATKPGFSLTTLNYTSYKDIPGVTAEEIQAIETLQKQAGTLVYGVNPSTEAFYGADGKIKGFTALFCDLLTKLFDIPFNPQFYGLDDLIVGLENGKIAFTGDLTATDELRKTYFMTDPVALRSVKLFRLMGSQSVQDIAIRRKPKYAFLEGTTTSYGVKAILGEYYETFFVENYEEAYKMLKSNEVDAFLDEGTVELTFDVYGDVMAEYFFPLLYSDVSLATQTPAYKPIISVVQKMLINGGDKYLAELYNTGHGDYMKNKLFTMLNEEEKKYIQRHTENGLEIPFLAESDNYPISFYNVKERQWQGIAFDVLREVGILTGLSFNIINEQSTEWAKLQEMLENGKGSVITELIHSQKRENRFKWPKSAVVKDYYALLSKTELRNINFNEILYMKIGVVHGTVYSEQFHKWFATHTKVVEYESTDLLFSALERGEVDMAMTGQNKLFFLTNFLELPGFKINLLFDLPFESTFGFHKGDSTLCNIVDKSLNLIDTKSISDGWTRKIYDYRTKIAQEKIPLFFGIGALFLCVLLLLLILFLRNRNEGKRLERVVQARTVELKKSHDDLKVAIQAAETANRAKSTFLANMSHEIRTPMNSVIGFSELALMERNSLPSNIREYLEKIIESSKWLLQIVNNILDISKIEFGKMDLEVIPFNLHEVFASCRTATLPKAMEKGLDLHFYAEPLAGKKLLGDSTKLTQIFINLVSNAIKFTDSGTVKSSSYVKNITKKSCTVRFEVKDNGIGMTQEQVNRIFDPFIQGDSSTTRKYGGTGLGLTITKNLIELMGGTLSVESTLKVGSVFAFELNFDMVNTHEHTANKFAISNIEKPLFDSEVLVCEDNKMNQKVISGHLAKVGLRAVLAENGKEGVDIMKSRFTSGQRPFRLVFMDIHMPVMDGLEAAAQIRTFDNKTPIVALTANVMINERELYKKSGIYDFLGKPFTSQELWQCLMKYLNPVNKKHEATESGLDEAAQKELKVFFVKENGNKVDEITDAIKAGDIKLAHILAHSLKGSAALIGQSHLQDIAFTIEEKLKNGRDETTEEDMQSLEKELKNSLEELQQLV